MAEPHHDLAGLAQLHRLDSMDQVRALWRRGMATLAAVASEFHPVPLEGFSPAALLAGARLALSHGLFDDMDWLSPAAAAVALFELASALPRGNERRDLGRRVLTALHHGNAETFVALATALVLGTRRGLSGEQLRARVALSLYMPLGMGTRPDALALALISRRESEREWLSGPSMGSLPGRRLAARLLERAAREAARRASTGDHTGVQVFNQPSVSQAFYRLLSDRESLVWRHVAAARGLLSEAVPAYINVIEHNLSEDLTPTEWRRAAASLAARIAIDPDETITRCNQLLYSEIPKRDPGVVAAMVYGLPCAAEAELAAAEELLDELASVSDIFAVEALVDLRRERIDSEFGKRAALHARALLRDQSGSDDDGMWALRDALHDELAPHGHRGPACALEDNLVVALEAFAQGGVTATVEATDRAMASAEEFMLQLERTGDSSGAERRLIFRSLRALDRGLLETNTLSDLLSLRTSTEESLAPLDRVRARLTRWLLKRERQPVLHGSLAHVTLRRRRVRTLLHLVDADDAYADSPLSRDRRMGTLSILLTRMRQDVPSPLGRTVYAALARVGDAIIREDILELSDVFIALAMNAPSHEALEVSSDASMEPGLKRLLREYAEFVRALEAQRGQEEPAMRACLEAYRHVADAVPVAQTPRVGALRSALQRLGQALTGLRSERSLTTLDENEAVFTSLEASVQALAQLTTGVGRRIDSVRVIESPRSGAAVRTLQMSIDRAVRGDDDSGIADSVTETIAVISRELPPTIAELVAMVLERISTLSLVVEEDFPDSGEWSTLPSHTRIAPWLPPGRTLGGFYILRTVGKGAVGSVFVAKRVEERHDESAECFALKVPEYHGAAAHTLSEAEFLRLFREEARALLALPEHPNLARFVTFDVGARPKPILVMELVPGPTLERILDREEPSTAKALAMLDGIASGLGAMHSAGVAHLDVKPSNIILRETTNGNARSILPVLVDFGLAGRKIRPGCATVHYGAPEIWSRRPHLGLEPMPTDVYAFACLAFEVLTDLTLFDGDTAVSIVNAHMSHSGMPPLLEKLASTDEYRPLATILSSGLRPDPQARASITELRIGLSKIAPMLAKRPWPIG